MGWANTFTWTEKVTRLGPTNLNHINTAIDELKGVTHNVKDHGALGNGSTDDTTAIQAAFNAVPSSGGVVHFPTGIYRVSAPITVKNLTTIQGCNQLSPFAGGNSTHSCVIRAKAGYTSTTGMLNCSASGSKGFTIKDIALNGYQDSSTRSAGAGLAFSASGAKSERVTVENIYIEGFLGDGVTGGLQHSVWFNPHIYQNVGWGMNAGSTGGRWNDCKIFGGWISWNQTGGMKIGDGATFTSPSSGFVVVGTRFERSGADQSVNGVSAGFNSTAPGVRIEYGEGLVFLGCETDANQGNGFEVAHTGSGQSGRNKNITFDSCRLGRDGHGTFDSGTLDEMAGIKVQGWSNTTNDRIGDCRIINCSVTTGKAADSTVAGDFTTPKYGVWIENTLNTDVIGGRINAVTTPVYYGPGGATSNVAFQSFIRELGIMTLPTSVPASPDTGYVWWDNANHKLIVFDGTTSYHATLTTP